MKQKKLATNTNSRSKVGLIKSCPECNKSYGSQKELDIHLKKSHVEQQQQQKTTKKNTKTTTTTSEVVQPPPPPPINNNVCKQCGKFFSSEYILIQHTKDVHQQIEEEEKKEESNNTNKSCCSCSICNKTFPTERYLKVHTTKFHPLKYPCKLCTFIYLLLVTILIC